MKQQIELEQKGMCYLPANSTMGARNQYFLGTKRCKSFSLNPDKACKRCYKIFSKQVMLKIENFRHNLKLKSCFKEKLLEIGFIDEIRTT